MTLFLDIDGVLVPAKSWENPVILSDDFPDFTKSSVKVLQQIITDSTNIILTTSHRFRFSLEEWRQIFLKRGIQLASIQRLGESQEGVSRREELLKWFSHNDWIEDFIIIDDDNSLNNLPSNFKNRLVLTSSFIGLTDNHLDQINEIMNDSILY